MTVQYVGDIFMTHGNVLATDAIRIFAAKRLMFRLELDPEPSQVFWSERLLLVMSLSRAVNNTGQLVQKVILNLSDGQLVREDGVEIDRTWVVTLAKDKGRESQFNIRQEKYTANLINVSAVSGDLGFKDFGKPRGVGYVPAQGFVAVDREIVGHSDSGDMPRNGPRE
jgi:hypothetical protein